MGEVVRAHGRDKSRLKVKTQHKPVVTVPVQHQQKKSIVHRQEESIVEVRTHKRTHASVQVERTYVRTHVGVRCRGGPTVWRRGQ